MRKLIAALGLILLGAAPALADAFSDQYTGMVGRIPLLTPPYTTSDRLSVVRNGIPYKVPLPAIPISPILNLYPANSYGSCTWDATHDVGTCINLAIAAAAAAGGGTVVCPAGTYGLTTMVRIQTSYITLACGEGSGTTLKAIAAMARMVSVDAPFGTTSDFKLRGNNIDVGLDGNALAADGLYLASLFYYWVNFQATGQFDAGNVLTLDVVHAVNGATFGEAIDIQNGVLNYNIVVSGTSTSVLLNNYTSSAGVGGNASLNDFYNNFIVSSSAKAILCSGCDNNKWHSGRVFNNNISVDLNFGHSAFGDFPANGNRFMNGFAYSGSFQARGTPTVPGCTPVTVNPTSASCTYDNWLDRDETNGVPIGTVEAGADLKDSSNAGFFSGLSFAGRQGIRPGIVATETYTTIGACLGSAFTNGSIASIYLCNTNGGGLAYFDSLDGDRFAMHFVGSAGARDLEFLKIAGTGGWKFSSGTIFSNSHVSISASTDPALTSCGTNPAIVGDDQAGEVTMGTGSPITCIITFHTAYAAAPLCVVTWQGNPLASQSYALTTTAITLTQTATSSNKVNYMCRARSGG